MWMVTPYQWKLKPLLPTLARNLSSSTSLRDDTHTFFFHVCFLWLKLLCSMSSDKLFQDVANSFTAKAMVPASKSLPHHHGWPVTPVILLQKQLSPSQVRYGVCRTIDQVEGCPQMQHVRKEVPRNQSRQEGCCVTSKYLGPEPRRYKGRNPK